MSNIKKLHENIKSNSHLSSIGRMRKHISARSISSRTTVCAIKKKIVSQAWQCTTIAIALINVKKNRKRLSPTVLLNHPENRSYQLFWQLLSLHCSLFFTDQSLLIGKIRLSRHLTSPDLLTIEVEPIQVFPNQIVKDTSINNFCNII